MGTAIGAWLELANSLPVDQDAVIKHGILLTDGHNEHRQPYPIDPVLRQCRHRFVCDCCGLGRRWAAPPMPARTRCTAALRACPARRRLVDGFRAMAESLMSTMIANVALRMWHPQGGRVRFLVELPPGRRWSSCRALAWRTPAVRRTRPAG